jgi:hypothetical protein
LEVPSTESAPSAFKDSKERLAVPACSKAAGTHKGRLLAMGESRNPRALKGVRDLSVTYTANKRAWITRQIFLDWFENRFVPSARAYCTSAGLASDVNIMLILGNLSAHLDGELLAKDTVFAVYLPPTFVLGTAS